MSISKIFWPKIPSVNCMSESETTSASNWKLIMDGKTGRRGAFWEKVIFTLDFLALKVIISVINKYIKTSNNGIIISSGLYIIL